MLLIEEDLRVEGDQPTILVEVYQATVQLLEGTGMPHHEANALACTLLPRLQARWATVGCLVRDVADQ